MDRTTTTKMTMNKFFSLKVLQINEETQDSKSIEFEIPETLLNQFKYKPGQYLTLQFNVNGEEVRRAYSICSSPQTVGKLKIGVKRVKGGLVSNYINDKVKVGDTVDVLSPMGDFTVDVSPDHYKSYYLFAAGSGITPILSILKTVLEVEVNSYVYMVFGNKNKNTIMFNEELLQLQKQYSDRFEIEFTLSKPKSSWKSLFSSNAKDYQKGRIDTQYVHQFINSNPPFAQDAQYYICGPEAMIINTKNALQSIDVPTDRIHIEFFGTAKKEEGTTGVSNATLTAYINDERVVVEVPKAKTILRTLLDNKHDMPYSCEGGVCGMCKCKLTKGEVKMSSNLALEEEDIENGYILACQSVPLTETLEIHVNE